MATTNFTNGVSLTDAGWFNDVDAAVYEGTLPTGATALTVTGATTLAVYNTIATTVNAFGAASVALNIGHASAAAAFPGGISIPTGKTLSGAGAINISGAITGAAGSFTTGTFSGVVATTAAGNAARYDATDSNATGATITLNSALSGVGTPAVQTQTNHPILIAVNNVEVSRFTSAGINGVLGGTTPAAATVTTLTASSSVTSMSGTATPVGGNANYGYFLGSAFVAILFGSGAPTANAAKGSLYLRTDGSGTSDRAYINTNGSNTWTTITTAG